MKDLTYRENGRWGIEGVDLASLPAPVYAAVRKLCDLEHPIAPTNAEKLRSMTDEKMARFLLRVSYNVFCQNADRCDEQILRGEKVPEDWCETCLLNWLKTPWEEVGRSFGPDGI